VPTLKQKIIFLLAVTLLLSGCARLSLNQAVVELQNEQTVLTIRLSNKGTPIYLKPLEAKIRDNLGSEFSALDYTGNLTDPIGDGYGESVSGTIIFPPIDPNSERVQVEIISSLLSGEQSYVSKIGGEITDGISAELVFGR
jgi:hypothetical protein